MFDGEKFLVFFQNYNLEIKNKVFSLVLSKFFVSFLKKVFSIEDFIEIFYKNNIKDKSSIKFLFDLLVNKDVFLWDDKFYKELFYLSKKWYNPYYLNYKLDYKYSDITFYYDNWLLSKNIIKIDESWCYSNLLKRKSYRTKYIKTNKSIYNDICKLLELSYWNIRYEQHKHVCSEDIIYTVHKTVPSAWGFYSIVLFTILSDWIITYFNWYENVIIWKNINYFKSLKTILTKSAIFVKDLRNKWAIQFVNINNTKWIIIAYWLVDKVYKKYYNKTLPFLLLETWHIFQNLSLFSNDYNIWTLELWSILEENISKYLVENIDNSYLRTLFEEKKLLYLNTMITWYIKE